MVVTKNPEYLKQTTQWVQRLDRSDSSGTTLRTFRLKNGNATQVARILSDIFVTQRSGAGSETPVRQTAPGVETAQSRLNSLDRNSGTTTASAAGSGSTDNRNSAIAAAFESFAGRKDSDPDASASASPSGASATCTACGTSSISRPM